MAKSESSVMKVGNNHVVFGLPPSYTSSCDKTLRKENEQFIGGEVYQSKWGRITKKQNAVADTRLYPVTFTVGKPKTVMTMANAYKGILESGKGEAKNRMTANGLKTFDFGSAFDKGSNLYLDNVQMLLEMLGYGEQLLNIPLTQNSFINPAITKISNFQVDRCQFPKVTFMASEETNLTETVQNEVAASMIESIIGSGSKIAREMSFMKGMSNSVSNMADDALDASDNDSRLGSLAKGMGKKAKDYVEGIVGEDIMQSVISGNQIILPKVWQQSSFIKTYTIQVRLFAPYAHRFSLAKNIYVPLAYIFGFALPSQPTNSTMGAPLLVRVDSPGAFNIPLGLVTNVSLKKGGKLDLWTKSGQFRALDVTIEIADLYDKLPMPLKKLYEEDGDDSTLRHYMSSLVGSSIPEEQSHMRNTRKQSMKNMGVQPPKEWTFASLWEKAKAATWGTDEYWAKKQRILDTYDNGDMKAVDNAAYRTAESMKKSLGAVADEAGSWDGDTYSDIQEEITYLQQNTRNGKLTKLELAEGYEKQHKDLQEFLQTHQEDLSDQTIQEINGQLTDLSLASSKMRKNQEFSDNNEFKDSSAIARRKSDALTKEANAQQNFNKGTK